MTGRERLVAAARGGETDRRADLARDAVVVPDADGVMADDERAVLVEALNPFGQALARGDDPHTAVLPELVEATRGAILDALDAGADGILYRLHGAHGDVYGRYRPYDRALLEEIADARLNVLFAVPPFDLELVKDLPAHVFAWSGDAPDAATVRAARAGAQASLDPLSEIALPPPEPMFDFALPTLDAVVLAPPVIVALTGLLALGIELFSPRRNNNAIVATSIVGLLLALAALGAGSFFGYGATPMDTGAGALVRDPLGVALQAILVVGTVLVVLFSEPYLRERRVPFAEFYPLILWSTTGAMLMVGTTHLLVLFLGLEILSIAIYVMAGMNRGEARSGESALKYFLLGSFASAFLLYGIALVYGATGSLSLEAIPAALLRNAGLTHTLLLVGLGMMLVGLSFKSSLAPFHQWTPDVYQGAPTNVTAFMATGSKVAALGALYRILDAFSGSFAQWAPAVGLLAVLTMIVGNVAALAQRDVKRILGYSSVAQAGYVIVAIVAHAKRPHEIGPESMVFFLLSYVLTTIGALVVVGLSARGEKEPTDLDDLRGLSRRSPLAAGALAFFALSLIGLPPLGGFFGKFYVLGDALRAEIPSLAIVLALTSALSVVYYLRLARAPFVDAEGETAGRVAPASRAALVVCGLGVLALAFFSAPLFNAIGLGGETTRAVSQR